MKCKQPECDTDVLAKELCSLHYQRLRAGKSLEVDACSVCGGPLRPNHKRGICRRTAACKTASNRAYFEENKDKLSKRQAGWYQENSERILKQQSAWRKSNTSKVQANRRWANYRIRPEQFSAMLENQGGACLGCGKDDVPLMLDHDHACCPGLPTCGNCNRGLLCDRCNRGIGFVFERPATLRALANYLEAWETREV